jgi:arabinose-5-phosphate isomerase
MIKIDEKEILEYARHVFDVEIKALQQMRDSISSSFSVGVNALLSAKGHIIVTGVGKSYHIAEKIAATMSSLGKAAFALHPGNALHGDLGMITNNDIVLVISNSGESDEIVRMLSNVKLIGAYIIAMTSNENSTLAHHADLVCKLVKAEEACHLNVAPTSSSTVALVYGDALAVLLSVMQGFTKTDYALFHPAGSLGKSLIVSVSDLMRKLDERLLCVKMSDIVTVAVSAIGENGTGAVTVTDTGGNLAGIVTQGDLRRAMSNRIDIYETKVTEIMNKTPLTVEEDMLAVDALLYMRRSGPYASVMPVVREGRVTGMIMLHDIIKAGIVD